jgi:hypothetical protein
LIAWPGICDCNIVVGKWWWTWAPRPLTELSALPPLGHGFNDRLDDRLDDRLNDSLNDREVQ